jgi:hypothetical protein
MRVNHDTPIEIDPAWPRINRRTFLIWSAHLAVCMAALASDGLVVAAAGQQPAPTKGYGAGVYGRGPFSGASVYTVYLPTVAKEENEHGAFTSTRQ